VLRVTSEGIATNADQNSRISSEFAFGIANRIGSEIGGNRLAGQSSGRKFESICMDFIAHTFSTLEHLRPGEWNIQSTGSKNRLVIALYQQYEHLIALNRAAKTDPELAAALGSDYTITPDIIIARMPEPDTVINKNAHLVNDECANLASLRHLFNPLPILHASISCKWTIRSDRAQNSRSEALNLIRNRKGPLPHIVGFSRARHRRY
jgi:hypothetical protein